jgi:hypothetical protein
MRKYDSTVARIAGNLLSGFPFDEYNSDDTIRLAREAVALARAIVAETERTQPAAAEAETGALARG